VTQESKDFEFLVEIDEQRGIQEDKENQSDYSNNKQLSFKNLEKSPMNKFVEDQRSHESSHLQ
jgi:hypothetical protein